MKETVLLDIAGMSCGHCVAAVTKALRGVDGIEVDKVAVGSATVSFDPSVVSSDTIAQAIEAQGYTVSAPR